MSEQEPTRWLEEDGALSGDERRALSAGLSPAVPPNAKAAVWGALGAKLPLAAGAAGATGAAAAAAAKATTALSLVKVGLVGVVLGSVSAAALVGGERVLSHAPAATERSVSPSTRAPTLPPELPAAPPTRRGDEAAPLAAPPPSGAPAPRELPSLPAASTEEAPRSVTGTDVASPGRSVASFPLPAPSSPRAPDQGPALESRHVAEARARLRAGDAQGALLLLERVRRDYPAGLLGQERDALTIEALLAVGNKDQARKLARDFLAHYPKSPHAEPARRALR